MLEQYFLRPTTVDRIRSNWLAPQIEQYVEWMHAQKYAGRNITRRIALLCHFADQVFAGQAVGIKEVQDDIWLVSFMDYDLGYFDLETRVLEPLENPFGPKVLPMS